MAAPTLTADTATRLGFSLEDLARNRTGQLSEGQLASALWAGIGWTALLLAILAVCVVPLLVKVPLFARALSVLSLLVVGGICSAIAYGRWKDYFDPVIASVAGPAAFKAGHRTTTFLTIGARSFQFPKPKEVLTQGAAYRVYYLAHSGTPLSLEPMSEGSPSPP